MNEFVVYVGDDIDGEAITYYNTSFNNILNKSNPYKAFLTNMDFVYKSDLDGGYLGLDYYTPSSLLTENQFHEIRNKIRNGERL